MLPQLQARNAENTRQESANTAETKSVDAATSLNLFKIIESVTAFKSTKQQFIHSKKVEIASENRQSYAMVALLGHHLGVISEEEIAVFSKSDSKDTLLFDFQNKVCKGLSELMNQNIQEVSGDIESKLNNYYIGFNSPESGDKETYLFIGSSAACYGIETVDIPEEALILIYQALKYLNKGIYCVSTVTDLIGYSAFGHDEITEMEKLITRFGSDVDSIIATIIKEEIYPFYEMYEAEYHEQFIEEIESKVNSYNPLLSKLIDSSSAKSVKEITRKFNKILKAYPQLKSHDFYKIMNKLIFVAKKIDHIMINLDDVDDVENEEMPIEFASTILFNLQDEESYCDDFYNFSMEMAEEPTLKIKISYEQDKFANIKNIIDYVGYILGFLNYAVSL